MKKIFVDEIREGDEIRDIFLVKEKIPAVSRSGSSYLNLRLMDKTGEVEGRVWEKADELSLRFKKDDFIKIKAKAIIFQKRLQLNIMDIRQCGDSEISADDFLSRTKKDVEKMYAELRDLSRKVKDQYLQRLLTLFLEDEEFARLFKKAPAAKGLHHAYLGGLLEHTLSLCKLILSTVPHYEGISVDLLFAGGILHDIGKIYELSYERSFDYTDEGRLLGHITMGVKMIEDKIKKIPGFPPNLAMLLEHLILSHHGQYSYGSPKKPKILEAIILYYLDDLDAKINGIQNFIEKEKVDKSSWTGYHSLYERFIYKGVYPGEDDAGSQKTLPFSSPIKNEKEKV